MKIKITESGRKEIQAIIISQLDKRQRKSVTAIQIAVIGTMIANMIESGREFIDWYE